MKDEIIYKDETSPDAAELVDQELGRAGTDAKLSDAHSAPLVEFRRDLDGVFDRRVRREDESAAGLVEGMQMRRRPGMQMRRSEQTRVAR